MSFRFSPDAALALLDRVQAGQTPPGEIRHLKAFLRIQPDFSLGSVTRLGRMLEALSRREPLSALSAQQEGVHFIMLCAAYLAVTHALLHAPEMPVDASLRRIALQSKVPDALTLIKEILSGAPFFLERFSGSLPDIAPAFMAQRLRALRQGKGPAHAQDLAAHCGHSRGSLKFWNRHLQHLARQWRPDAFERACTVASRRDFLYLSGFYLAHTAAHLSGQPIVWRSREDAALLTGRALSHDFDALLCAQIGQRLTFPLTAIRQAFQGVAGEQALVRYADSFMPHSGVLQPWMNGAPGSDAEHAPLLPPIWRIALEKSGFLLSYALAQNLDDAFTPIVLEVNGAELHFLNLDNVAPDPVRAAFTHLEANPNQRDYVAMVCALEDNALPGCWDKILLLTIQVHAAPPLLLQLALPLVKTQQWRRAPLILNRLVSQEPASPTLQQAMCAALIKGARRFKSFQTDGVLWDEFETA